MLSATAELFCRQFLLAEIQLATGDFNDEHLIGKGGFGNVYKGLIDDGQETVAIKRLAPNSHQGEHEFVTEIETLSKLRHVNLVSLVGYCNEHTEMILVYEYIPRGTLADYLYKLSGRSDDSLTWNQRLNICIGAGRGIDYLHTGSSIIHRDVKSTNILLDDNFTAKVSDFGLAKHLSARNSKSHVSTVVKGSFGYLDPSYFTTGRLTRNSDTYAFGVALLEVLSGRPAVDPTLVDQGGSLVMWAQEKISKRKVDRIVASNLREEISADCLKTFVGVVKRCLHHVPQKRPTMGEAVIQLQLAFKQQESKAPTQKASRFLLCNAFWNRVKPPGKSGLPLCIHAQIYMATKQLKKVITAVGSRASGSLQKDHNQVDINTMSTAVPVIQEDASKDEQTVIILPSVESEDKLTVNVLPIAVPAMSILELIGITNNFSAECLIGEGSNGTVYRGFKNGQASAIKMLGRSGLPEQEFLAQVLIASSLKHEHVVQLLGYCVDGGRKFLAYAFAQGSLHDFLHNTGVLQKGVKGSRSWSQRVKIAVGVAKGLEYIHAKGHIHCNIKSSNVLLFDNGEVAKIADINLAYRRGSCTIPMFRGYDAPECAMIGQSSRSDVYCFGVVLLELLTGREPVDYPWLDMDLVTWARPRLHKNKVKEIVDARLKGDYPQSAVATMAEIASRCVQDEPRSRPDMSDVVKDIQRLLNS